MGTGTRGPCGWQEEWAGCLYFVNGDWYEGTFVEGKKNRHGVREDLCGWQEE